jgi:hypothetical protein
MQETQLRKIGRGLKIISSRVQEGPWHLKPGLDGGLGRNSQRGGGNGERKNLSRGLWGCLIL